MHFRENKHVIETCRELLGGEYQIVDLKFIQEQEQLAAVGRLARVVGHEFGNILQPLLTKMELLQNGLPGNLSDRFRPLLEEMIDATLLGAQICEDLLLVSKDSYSQPNSRAIKMREPIDRAVRLLGHEFKRRDIRLSLELPGTVIILANEAKLTQLMVNLFKNSLLAISDGGRIEVNSSIDAHEKCVSVSMEDDGCGIDDSAIPRLFAEGHPPGTESGNGLGLLISKGIVEEHGGRISIRSQRGSGTRVNFTLPIHAIEGHP